MVEHLADLPHLDCAQQSAESSVEDRPRIPDKDVFNVRLGDAVRSSERYESDHNWTKDIENTAVEDVEKTEYNNDERVKNISDDNQDSIDCPCKCACNHSPKVLKTILIKLIFKVSPPVFKNISSGCIADPVPGVNKALVDRCEDSPIVHYHECGDDVLDQIGSQTSHIAAVQGGLIDLPEKAHEQDDIGDILHSARDAC